jgi:hypothetical protein
MQESASALTPRTALARRSALFIGLFLALLLPQRASAAQHFELWYGYGIGGYLSGGEGTSHPNSDKAGGLSVSLAGDRLRLRYLHGSLERSGLPTHGDNDADYRGGDVVLTRRLTGLPVDLGAGMLYHEQAFVLPGGQRFVHRWGPDLVVFREHNLWRNHLLAHAEMDLIYVPYERKELFAVADLGVGLSF